MTRVGRAAAAPDLLAPELELTLALSGTRAVRATAAERIDELCRLVDAGRLEALLAEQRLLALVGSRLADHTTTCLPARFRAAVESARTATARDAALLESVTEALVGRLEDRGIAAMPLKGPLLARALYGDPGLRPSRDVDLLVSARDLEAAVAEVASLGWTLRPEPPAVGTLPPLHRHLVGPLPWLPSIELHWRVHWYEASFSDVMLARSRSDGGWRRALPEDELTTLLLVFARDGFVGLRGAADIAAWWDGHGTALAPGAMDAVVAAHPRLQRSIAAAATVAEALVAVPFSDVLTGAALLGRRTSRAVRLANWTRSGDPNQVIANVALVDALLAPPVELGSFVRRRLLPRAAAMRERCGCSRRARLRAILDSAVHLPKLAVRFSLALWATRARRSWSPLPSGEPRAPA
jgi:hypothetical protein